MNTQSTNKQRKQKSEDFFWTEVSPGVKNAEYAVRGLVPSTANIIKSEIKNKVRGNYVLIQSTHFQR